MISKRFSFIIIFFLLFFTTTFAQVELMNRLELDVKFSDTEYEIILTNEGVIGFKPIFDRVNGNSLEVFRINKELKNEKFYRIPISPLFSLTGHYLDQENLYLIYEKRGSSIDRILIEVNLEIERVRQYSLDKLTSMELKRFLVLEGTAVFQGVFEESPILQLFRLRSNETVTLPGIFFYRAGVIQIKNGESRDYFDVLIRKLQKGNRSQLSLISFNLEGDMIRNLELSKLGNNKMEYMESTLLDKSDDEQILLGTFGQRQKSAYFGVFQNKINDFGEQEISTFTLKNFPNFFNYLPYKKSKRFKKRYSRKLDRKNPPQIKPIFVVRDVIQSDESSLVYAEVFLSRSVYFYRRKGLFTDYSTMSEGALNKERPIDYQTQFTQNSISFNPNRRERSQVLIQKENFRYYSGHLFLIDKNDQIIWDDAVNIEPAKSNFPEKIGEVNFMKNGLVYHIQNENDLLKISTFDTNEGSSRYLETSLDTTVPDRSIEMTKFNSSKILHWYHDVYIFFSTERIKYLEPDGTEKTKDVFSINKLKIS